MCGIAGIIGLPEPPERVLLAMRDAMEHRGPDAAGIWTAPGVGLVHRRLAVLDPSHAGDQPMVDAEAGVALVFNGEIYNHRELRRSLGIGDDCYTSSGDTATLLRWVAAGMPLESLRGMYGFGWVDLRARTLTLARDPLGIKPLYWSRLPGRVIFASEVVGLFAHPELEPRPDTAGVRQYLTTIRTVIEDRTMFEGVRAVRPGQTLRFSLDRPDDPPVEGRIGVDALDRPARDDEAAETIAESIAVHLQTDVPICALLSGGLDSTIIASEVVRRVSPLRTYCASGPDIATGDALHARRVAELLGTVHHETSITGDRFLELWIDSIERTGLPMSTPNEVAIRRVAARVRADGCVVALTGEGADELFGGYDEPMRLAVEFSRSSGGDAARHLLDAHAWASPEQHRLILDDSAWRDDPDLDAVRAVFTRVWAEASEGAADEIGAHLRFHQRVNLVGLLQRLDTATMLESVEGRTPFADRVVQSAAWSIPGDRLYSPDATTMHERTKLVLRRAFRDAVPDEVLRRDKASFPLPFEGWLRLASERVLSCVGSAPFVRPGALAVVAADPARHWNLAWPLFNLVLWADRWWGRGVRGRGYAVAASVLGTAARSRRV